MVRIKKNVEGEYINRDTGAKLTPTVYIPLIFKSTKQGYLNYYNSKRFKLTKTNRLPLSIETIATRLGGNKEHEEKAKEQVATWFSNKKLAERYNVPFNESFPSP